MTGRDEKILVIKLGALGDFVQAFGAMAAIRRYHNAADITLLTAAPFVGFGENCGYFDHVWCDEKPKLTQIKSWLHLRKKLNAENFTRVYDLQNNDRTGFYFRLFLKKPEWVGIAKGASHRNISPQRTAGHAFEGHIQTLKLAGINEVSPDDLSWMKADVSRFSLNRPYILLVPGCAPSRPEKRWPAEHYGALARVLVARGFHPVIIGSEGEKDLAVKIQEMEPAAVDLTGQTTLPEIAVLARNAAGAIGNDTGPMHMVGQTGCRTYVLFSRHSNPVKHAPFGNHVQTLQAEELRELSVEQVLAFSHFD
ncbi:MAG: hypothetical protein CO093_08435 [Alphaproteobacteria bacterium CG_4_9_14_3_um_filter_47_13]|nr:MAG: hypothetical protein CO093_08435 [Alphaproteobacteria bacterium CG_4_9_14_3_um_filter_47_13]